MRHHELINHVTERGLKLDIVYDVGACTGEFSYNLISSVLPNAQYYLFEANISYLPQLIHPGFNAYIATLSNEGREEVEFWVGLNTGDSYYKETTTIYDDKDTKILKCTTLDKIITEKNLPIPNFLKIDTQGSELDILSASKKILGKTEMILCECPIIEYNKGAPNITEYLNFFRDHDYIPVELNEVHRAEDTLLQIDLIFMLRSAKNEFLSPNMTIRV